LNTKRIHLIAFDVPFPPNYGGIVDIFYKLKSLHENGVKVVLHCFVYRGHNKPSLELEQYCERVYYYRRNQNIYKLFFSIKPYIVTSRKNKRLLKNLCADNAPILFEGLHTCFYLDHPLLVNRKKYVRVHNIEHNYYIGLANIEPNFFKRNYFLKEAERLHAYEKILNNAEAIFSISKQEVPHFEQFSKVVYIPPFFITDHARHEVNKSNVTGRFILFHGNLRIKDNEKAAEFIINEIATKCKHKFVIAGKNPSNWLKNEASIEENVQMIDTPTAIQMDSLIQYAHINLLITNQQAGVKLKLIHALENGKFVIINSKMDDAGIFKDMCFVKDDADDIIRKIEDLIRQDYTDAIAAERNEKFASLFDNKKNAKEMIEVIFRNA